MWLERLLITCAVSAALLLGTPATSAAQDDTVQDGEEIVLSIEIEYLPKFHHDAEPGDLFVYLDGDLLSWTSRGGQFAPTPPDRLERRLAPGSHVLRLAHEDHEKKSKSWKHSSRVSPMEIVFVLEPGGSDALNEGALHLHIQEAQSVFSTDTEPIALTITQGDRTVYNVEKTGTSLRDWPLLCEDIEAGVPPGKKPKKSVRKELEECVRWEEMWRDVPRAMSREAMRKVLERYDYEPRTYKRFE